MSVQNIGRNRWRVIVKCGINPDTGRPRYQDKIVRGTKDDARALEVRLAGFGAVATPSLTLGDFLRLHWLPSLTVRDSTKEQYRYAIRHLESIADVRIARLSAQDIEGAMHALPPGNTRRQARKVLSIALNAALRWDVISMNPLPRAQVNIGRGIERDWRAYSADELQALLSAVQGDVSEATVLTMAFCGLRKEEALALDWEDIDLDAGAISISKAWAMDGGRPAMKETKTKGSERETYVRGWGLQRLRELGGDATGPLWKGRAGGRITPQAASRRHRRLVEAAGLRYIPLNCLRHTHATLALSSGIDVALVSKSLGHARISTTVNAYIRPLEDARRSAADAFAQVVGAVEPARMSRKSPENPVKNGQKRSETP
jgi:integrase